MFTLSTRNSYFIVEEDLQEVYIIPLPDKSKTPIEGNNLLAQTVLLELCIEANYKKYSTKHMRTHCAYTEILLDKASRD